MSAVLRPAPVWTNRPETGTKRSQTRACWAGSVSPEGGGTTSPTLGGGIWVARARATMEVSVR
jgi:hypothetical protein